MISRFPPSQWIKHTICLPSRPQATLTLCALLDIRYGAPSKELFNGRFAQTCIPSGTQIASFWGGENFAPGMPSKRGLLILCPKAFEIRQTAGDLPGKHEPSKCDIFNNAPYASKAMDTLSATLLHEFLHSMYMQEKINDGFSKPLIPIIDYWAEDDPGNTNNDPPDGYGSYNAMKLQQTGSHWPLYNDDSYTYFALYVQFNSAVLDIVADIRCLAVRHGGRRDAVLR